MLATILNFYVVRGIHSLIGFNRVEAEFKRCTEFNIKLYYSYLKNLQEPPLFIKKYSHTYIGTKATNYNIIIISNQNK